MEWAQAQWKKNLGFTVELKPTEQTVYLATLRENPPAIFRKGVGLDRSTCRAAVEIFSQGDPENFIRLADSKYEGLLKKLSAANSPAQAKQACSNAIRYLIDQAEIIPLGRIHFAMLAKESFNGWRVTPLNQLDLSRLRVVQK
jgi:oligopeptide transport system substrate-binding protein